MAFRVYLFVISNYICLVFYSLFNDTSVPQTRET